MNNSVPSFRSHKISCFVLYWCHSWSKKVVLIRGRGVWTMYYKPNEAPANSKSCIAHGSSSVSDSTKRCLFGEISGKLFSEQGCTEHVFLLEYWRRCAEKISFYQGSAEQKMKSKGRSYDPDWSNNDSNGTSDLKFSILFYF